MKKLMASAVMMMASVAASAATIVAANTATIDELRLAAEEGKCLESVVGQLIQQQGTQNAQAIVNAAFVVLNEFSKEQKALGCSGAIGQAAIAAGADPNDVLAATAAGLGAPGAGGPNNLGGLTGGTTGGGVAASLN